MPTRKRSAYRNAQNDRAATREEEATKRAKTVFSARAPPTQKIEFSAFKTGFSPREESSQSVSKQPFDRDQTLARPGKKAKTDFSPRATGFSRARGSSAGGSGATRCVAATVECINREKKFYTATSAEGAIFSWLVRGQFPRDNSGLQSYYWPALSVPWFPLLWAWGCTKQCLALSTILVGGNSIMK